MGLKSRQVVAGGSRPFLHASTCLPLLACITLCLHHSMLDPWLGLYTRVLCACALFCMRDLSGLIPQLTLIQWLASC